MKKVFGFLVLGVALAGACQGLAESGESEKSVPRTIRIEQFMDLRNGFARKPLKAENA